MAEIKRRNLSTEHQKPGDAKRPKDTLDRDRSRGEQPEESGKRADVSRRPVME